MKSRRNHKTPGKSYIRPSNIVNLVGLSATHKKSVRSKRGSKANRMEVEISTRKSGRSVKPVNRYDPKKQEEIEKKMRLNAAIKKVAAKKAAIAGMGAAAAAPAAVEDLNVAMNELAGLMQEVGINRRAIESAASSGNANINALLKNIRNLGL